MRKRYTLLLFSLIMVSIGLVEAVVTCPVDGVNSATGCVCEHSPNSSLGYGQVQIGPTIISCDNNADGVCPEDYYDPSSFTLANCGNCLDPDCTAIVQGNVTDTSGNPLGNIMIIGYSPAYLDSLNLTRNTTTSNNVIDKGWYSYPFITGTYTFKTSNDNYSTEVVPTITVTRGKITTLNFSLSPKASCNNDCTDSSGKCNSGCNGIDSCNFLNNDVMNVCNGIVKGTDVRLNDTHYVTCCDGMPYPKIDPLLNESTTGLNGGGRARNLIKIERIARITQQPSRIIIAYWQ